MKKIILSILVLFVATASLSGQVSRRGKDIESGRYDNTPLFGIVGGVGSPKFEYSDKNISDLPVDMILRSNVGVFMEVPIGNFFSISPELLVAYKGFKTSYLYGNQPYNVVYEVQSRYLSLRMPFLFRISFGGKHNVQPFFFVSPDFSYLLGGKIKLSQEGLPIPEANTNIGKANMNNIDAGLYFGLGLRCKFRVGNYMMLARLDAGYNVGFINTFSNMEIDETSMPLNVNAYNNTGTRLNRALEVNIHISVPIRIRKPGCDEINKVYREMPAGNKSKYKKGRNLDKTFGK